MGREVAISRCIPVLVKAAPSLLATTDEVIEKVA
jgi:hypothetical protein